MTTKKVKGTISDQIADILTTAPGNLDAEEDAQDETSAKVDAAEEYEAEEEQVLSNFRKLNVDLLADVDERYAGKKSSRKNLKGSDEDESEELEDSDEELSSEEENVEDSIDDNGSEGVFSEGEQKEYDEGNFKQLNETNVSQKFQKGQCVKNQLIIWENLLEMRIQLQKCVTAANKMPQNEKFKQIQQESGKEFRDKANETKTSLCTLLDKFLQLQNILQKQFPETKKINQKQSDWNQKKEDDDEEIASDSNEELSESNDDEEAPSKKKMRTEDYKKEISNRHEAYKGYRNEVIQKWHEKTRLSSLKNNLGTNHSIINHIEHILSDRDKLVKRTQLKRTNYQILGEEPRNEDSTSEEYNTEIFDDNDFYHQLLRELIEVKSVDLMDPVQLGRQWMQLQNLRNKMKRKIDTRATKGRKIRYAVHSKLVNFMSPIEENPWNDEAKNELYNSLFGKKV